MCLILFQWQPDTDHPLLVLSNRDEFYHRPAQAAHWRGAILSGLDLSAGGTWLGADRRGRFAAVTNFREPQGEQPAGLRSRGELPLAFLHGTVSPEQYLEQVYNQQNAYRGFNLLVYEQGQLWYMSNRGAEPQPVAPGVHGLSNALLNTPWPKVEKGKQALHQHLARLHPPGPALPEADKHALLDIMLDDSNPAAHTLPDTGVGHTMEKLVAPIFIRSPAYGTRVTTLFSHHQHGCALSEWHHQGSAELQHFAWP